jgi:hypothetical protein
MCHLSVKRVTHLVHISKSSQRITHLEQWSTLIVPETPENLVWRGVKINHMGILMQDLAVVRPTDDATTGRDNS